MLSVPEYSARFTDYLAQRSLNNDPKNLYEPINYILDLGGKRLRPVLTLMAAELFDTPYEKALDAELDEHLGYDRHEPKHGTNSRNGYTKKTVKTDDGELEINTPRDRQSEFEPHIIKKRQTRTPALDSKVLSLYAKGMTRALLSTR